MIKSIKNNVALRILVTGANGFVGTALCDVLHQQRYFVRAAVRVTQSVSAAVEIVQIGDLDGGTEWQSALQNVDVVVHLAARVHVMRDEVENPLLEFRRVNVDGTENLARQAVQAGVKRLVYVSSIKVNGEQTTTAPYSELDLPAPQDAYGISKWEAEQVLHRVALETGLEVVIVRPPLVYGAGVKGNFGVLFSAILRGIPLPLAAAKNMRSLVYVGNLVDALLKCATHPNAAGKTYLVSDGADISTPALVSRIAAALNCPERIFYVPLIILRVVARLFGKSKQMNRLFGSLQVNSGKICQELDWLPPYSVQDGLQETVKKLGRRTI